MSFNPTQEMSLTRKVPMKRTAFKRKPVAMKKTNLKRMSKKKASEMRKYHGLSKTFLERPENMWCYICICMKHDLHFDVVKNAMLNKGGYLQTLCRDTGSGINYSSETHHRFGRVASLLNDERGWCPSCASCRLVPHTKGIKARELGLIGSVSTYGVPIDRHTK
jgi:hypothetical protein